MKAANKALQAIGAKARHQPERSRCPDGSRPGNGALLFACKHATVFALLVNAPFGEKASYEC